MLLRLAPTGALPLDPNRHSRLGTLGLTNALHGHERDQQRSNKQYNNHCGAPFKL
jgi:hypothetical protein